MVIGSPGIDLAALGRLPARYVAILGYTGIAATGGAYLGFVLGLHRSRSAASGLAATLIQPGVAALLGGLVLRERLPLWQAAGCVLMLVAMSVLFRAERAWTPRKPGDASICRRGSEP